MRLPKPLASNATAPSVSYGLAGTPTTKAIISLGGGPLDFGTAGIAIDGFVRVDNSGGVGAGLADGMTLAAPFSFTTGVFPGGSGTATVLGQVLSFCGASLPGNSSCVLSVRFSGQASGSATLTLNTSNAYAATATRPVQGAATSRALLSVSESDGYFACSDSTCGPAGFGAAPIGSTRTMNLLVINRGAQAATALGQGMALAAPFSFASGVYPGGTGSAMVAHWKKAP